MFQENGTYNHLSDIVPGLVTPQGARTSRWLRKGKNAVVENHSKPDLKEAVFLFFP